MILIYVDGIQLFVPIEWIYIPYFAREDVKRKEEAHSHNRASEK